MPDAARGPRRSTALLWAAIAEVVLGGLAVALLTTFDADDDVPFGVPGASTVIVAAMAVTAVGAAFAAKTGAAKTSAAKTGASAGRSRAVALVVAFLVAVAAGVVAALTLGCFFSPNGSVVGLGIPLALAVAGMSVVAARVAAPTRRQGVS
jgi:hypothetical protein